MRCLFGYFINKEKLFDEALVLDIDVFSFWVTEFAHDAAIASGKGCISL
jgi:hypothetical protein